MALPTEVREPGGGKPNILALILLATRKIATVERAMRKEVTMGARIFASPEVLPMIPIKYTKAEKNWGKTCGIAKKDPRKISDRKR